MRLWLLLVKKKGIDEDIVVNNEVFSEYDEHAIVKTELQHKLKQEFEHAIFKLNLNMNLNKNMMKMQLSKVNLNKIMIMLNMHLLRMYLNIII